MNKTQKFPLIEIHHILIALPKISANVPLSRNRAHQNLNPSFTHKNRNKYKISIFYCRLGQTISPTKNCHHALSKCLKFGVMPENFRVWSDSCTKTWFYDFLQSKLNKIPLRILELCHFTKRVSFRSFHRRGISETAVLQVTPTRLDKYDPESHNISSKIT